MISSDLGPPNSAPLACCWYWTAAGRVAPCVARIWRKRFRAAVFNPWLVFMILYYIILYYLIWYSCHKILSSTLCGATSWHGAKCHWMKTRKTEIRIVCAVAHDLDSFRFNLYNSSCHYFRMLPNFQGYWYSTKSRVNKHVPFHFHAHITVYRYVQYPTLFLSLFYFFCIRRYG